MGMPIDPDLMPTELAERAEEALKASAELVKEAKRFINAEDLRHVAFSKNAAED